MGDGRRNIVDGWRGRNGGYGLARRATPEKHHQDELKGSCQNWKFIPMSTFLGLATAVGWAKNGDVNTPL